MAHSTQNFAGFPAAAQPGLQVYDDTNVLDQAIASSKAGDFSNAERLFRAFLLRQPDHVRALDQFGILLAQIGRYEEAERHIRTAIGLGSRSGGTFYNHGIILKYLQRPLEALDAFNKALAIKPTDPETWNNRGTVFNDLARYGEAIHDFDKAISLRADFAGAFCNRAKSLLLSGRHEEALAACDKALAMRPELLEMRLGRANACYQLKRYDEALATYDRVLALKPDLAEAWLGRSSVFGRLERHDEALAGFDKVLTVKPDLAEAWFGRANACFLLNRYGEALAAYEKTLALKPDSAEAWVNYGGILARLKRHDEALAGFDRALTIRPDLAKAWLGRGEALHVVNRPDEAIVAFRQALAKGGDAEVIQYSLASLGADAAPVTAPKQLVTELFDEYADRFDEHLVGTLKYRAPDLLFDAMARFVRSHKLDILDLGCGTGLVGARFHPLARTLTGVDFSSNMLKVAQRRQIYDNLVCGELTDFLRTQAQSFDLVVGTDVFLYIGDLSGVFQGVRGALREGGLFGFSVEISEERDFVLRSNRHYAHSGAYLKKLAQDHGFVFETIETQVIRQHDGSNVVGYLAVLRRS
jgi:predicted TPR repeat methyltransferase